MAQGSLGTWSTCEQVATALGTDRVKGKTVVVTGASAGIGAETAFQLAKAGAHVVMACRNLEKATKVKEELLQREHQLDLTCMELDLSDLANVKHFAQQVVEKSRTWSKPLTCLVLNAGIYPYHPAACKQGFELTFATNHLGHFLLTSLLLPLLRENKPARVIVVSSGSHTGPISLDATHFESTDSLKEKLTPPNARLGAIQANKIYGDSKLCNVLFAKELHKREEGNGVTAASLHPGTLVTTDIARDMPAPIRFIFRYVIGMFTKNVNQGSSTSMYLALCPQEEMKGLFFDACRPREASDLANSPQAAAVLWDLSLQLCQPFLEQQSVSSS